jgi:hypothetical protein
MCLDIGAETSDIPVESIRNRVLGGLLAACIFSLTVFLRSLPIYHRVRGKNIV